MCIRAGNFTRFRGELSCIVLSSCGLVQREYFVESMREKFPNLAERRNKY